MLRRGVLFVFLVVIIGTSLPAGLRAEGPSRCSAEGTKQVSPTLVTLGEVISVTLNLEAHCPESHVVLVLEKFNELQQGSDSALQQVKKVAQEYIESLALATTGAKIGIVAYDSSVQILCELTSIESQAKTCLNQLELGGGTNQASALNSALFILRRDEGADTNETVILVTDGPNNQGCTAVKRAAQDIKDRGASVATVCYGRDCDDNCLSEVASTPSLYYPNNTNLPQLRETFTNVRMWSVVEIVQLVVTDSLAGVQVVTDTIRPEPMSIGETHIVWELQQPQALTYSARPIQSGPQRLGDGQIILVDSAGNDRNARIAGTSIEVLGAPTPTLTPTEASTEAPSATPTELEPTPSPTQRATPTTQSLPYKPGVIYLPWANRP